MPDQPTTHREFQDAMQAGDERLKDHIMQESARLALMTASAEKLAAAHVERLDGQLQMAREHMDAIFAEQRRAMVVAEQEREKSAKALRDELTRAIASGDLALSDHVRQQIENVMAALASAERLEVQRIGEIRSMVDGVQREVAIAFAASEKAIAKAETANEQRFNSMNEFREQLAEQAAGFIPREVFETMVASFEQRVRNLEQAGSQQRGGQVVERRQADRLSSWQLWAAGAVLSIVVLLSNGKIG